jgi:hypothetical protein
MKSGYRYILYIVIVILIASGLALLFMRNTALDFLNQNAGISEPDLVIKNVIPATKDTLDSSLLNSANFTALKNNVTKFDFNTICGTVVGQIVATSTSATGVVSTTTENVSCVKGNGLPFVIPVKKTTPN